MLDKAGTIFKLFGTSSSTVPGLPRSVLAVPSGIYPGNRSASRFPKRRTMSFCGINQHFSRRRLISQLGLLHTAPSIETGRKYAPDSKDRWWLQSSCSFFSGTYPQGLSQSEYFPTIGKAFFNAGLQHSRTRMDCSQWRSNLHSFSLDVMRQLNEVFERLMLYRRTFRSHEDKVISFW